MSLIRDFFKKRKVEAKFARAGPGHRLTDAKSSSSAAPKGSGSKASKSAGPAKPPASSAAAEAALKRLEQQHPDKGPKKALGVVLEEERKKVLEEYKLKEQIKAQRDLAAQEEQAAETSSTDANVKFCCPSLYISEGFPLEDLKAIIEEGIKESYREDLLLLNALLIKNCNEESNIELGISTIERVLSNLKTDDAEQLDKFKKLRLSKLQQKLQNVKGGVDFLKAAGFVVDETGEWFVYGGENAAIPDQVDYFLDVLRNAERFALELDREAVIITKDNRETSIEELDEKFFQLSAAEVARQQETLTRKREQEETLMTREMRNRLNRKPLSKYTRLRMKLPDEIFVEATFKTKETVADLQNWLMVNFSDNLQNFSIIHSGKTIPQESYSQTFEQLLMYPSAFLLVRHN